MSKYLDKAGLEHYHDLIKAGLFEYIEGTQSSATSTWTGVSTQPELFEGKLIIYHLPYAGASAVPTLNLTLPDGTTTGAKTVGAISGANYAAGDKVALVYNGASWDVVTPINENFKYLNGVTSNIQTQFDKLTDYYWWGKYTKTYSEKNSSAITAGFSDPVLIGPDYGSDRTIVEYASSYSFDPTTGALTLNNPTSLTIDAASTGSTLAGKYFKITHLPSSSIDGAFNTTDVYYDSDTTQFSTYTNPNGYGTRASFFKVISAEETAETFLEYVCSSSSTAYPNPEGVYGDYYYTYLGVPLDRAVTGAKVLQGEVIPSVANEMTIVTGFNAKVIIITGYGGGSYADNICIHGETYGSKIGSASNGLSFGWGDGQVSVSTTSSSVITPGYTYRFVAIG